jgi:hypothetical protein
MRYKGQLIPEVADHFRALQILPHLQARGLILNLDHRALVELGRALREADQDLDLDQYLAEVRMGQDQGMDQIGVLPFWPQSIRTPDPGPSSVLVRCLDQGMGMAGRPTPDNRLARPIRTVPAMRPWA